MKFTTILIAMLIFYTSKGQDGLELLPNGIRLPGTDSLSIASPVSGLIIYDSTSGNILYRDEHSWHTLSDIFIYDGVRISPSNEYQNTNVHLGGHLGVGAVTPVERLEVDGAVRLGAASSEMPEAGTIRWNQLTQDFEGYDGAAWRSLTTGCTSTGSSNTAPPVPPACCEEHFPASDAAPDDFFGGSVAIDGSYAVIGAEFAADSGRAYVYHYNDTVWSEMATLIPSNGKVNGSFGSSVDISGDRIIIGAKRSGAFTDGGLAYVFKRIGNTWVEEDILSPDDAEADAFFGGSVAIDGDYCVVGASIHDTDGLADAGQAYVFERIGTDWTPRAKLKANDRTADDFFGGAVDISGSGIVVGARRKSTGATPLSGATYFFQRIGLVWGLSGNFLAPDPIQQGGFGVSVSIDGSTAVVSAWVNREAYIYQYDGTSWTNTQTLSASQDQTGSTFGSDVSLSGDYIVIGSTGYDYDGITNAGQAYIFHFNGTTWTEIDILRDPFAQVNDLYGSAVATDSANRIVGASFADTNGLTNSGKVIFGPIN